MDMRPINSNVVLTQDKHFKELKYVAAPLACRCL